MTEERWQRIAEIYDGAQGRPKDRQASFVRAAAAGDSDLRRDVESLLAQDDQPALIDHPLDVAAHVGFADNSPVPFDPGSGHAERARGLQPGRVIGVYRIDAPLGVGGMGEVYRARDTKLNRDVAIKILPPAFANDPDRLARFKREAQVLASLNHPNIGAIYGLEGQEGQEGQVGKTLAIVMELVEGDTLADRIARGALPIDDALALAGQIANALEMAHEQGVIHRDLKPANIKVREDGTVKVLDFGLAKITEAGRAGGAGGEHLTQSPTITTPAMTAAGMLLGTAAYMSPEQAKGKPADKRSDIWAFGVVLYEMLTGVRPFQGDDVAETLAEVIKGAPDWTQLPPLSPSIRLLVQRCLEKDRGRRLGDVAAVRLLLSEPWVAAQPAPREGAGRWRRVGVMSVVALAAAAGVFVGRLLAGSPSLARPATRFEIPLPAGMAFGGAGGIAFGAGRWLGISPDGRQVAFNAADEASAQPRMMVRRFDESESRAVFPQGGGSPVFSPDGQSLFVGIGGSAARILRVPIAGGIETTTVRENPGNGFNWAGDRLIYSCRKADYTSAACEDGEGIIVRPAEGGAATVLIPLQPNETAMMPQLLPDGETVLFSLRVDATGERADLASWNRAQIVAESIRTHERLVIATGGSDARYLSSGHVIYGSGNNLMAVGFDLAGMKVIGTPVAVVQGVRRGSTSGFSQYSIADDGTLAYVKGEQFSGELALVTINREGKVTPLARPAGFYESPRFSPDGKRLAFHTDDGREARIWIYDLASDAPPRPLTFTGRSRHPVWSEDGLHVIFQSDREGDLAIYRQKADGTEGPLRLTRPADGAAHIPESWVRHGDAFSFSSLNRAQSPPAVVGERATLWLHHMQSGKDVQIPDVQSTAPLNSAVSPDGRWIAYGLRTLGRASVWVEPLPSTGIRYEMPLSGAHHPGWSADGSTLYAFPSGGFLTAVGVRSKPSFDFRAPTIPSGAFRANTSGLSARNHDMSPDGQQMVAVDNGSIARGREAPTSISVVLNWGDELKRLVPVP